MNNKTTRRADALRPATLRMPQQAPPVARSAAGAAGALGATDGVQPNGLGSWIDSLSHMIPGSDFVGKVEDWFGL